MKICKYGLTLTRLRNEDSSFVLQKFLSGDFSRGIISEAQPGSEQQQDWFFSINDLENIYYLVEYQGQKIGLVITENINWEKRILETEYYFWDETIQNSAIRLLASQALMETVFNFMNWNVSYAKAGCENKPLISQLLKLGYILSNRQENTDDQVYCLTAEQFNINYSKLKEEVKSLAENKASEDYLLLEPVDYESGIAQVIENNFLESGVYLHRRGIKGSRMYFR